MNEISNHTLADCLNYRGKQTTTQSGKEVTTVSAHAHNSALNRNSDFSMAMKLMIRNWVRYAEDHQLRYGSKIGEDGVLGKQWLAIGLGLRGLLNGETGGLDCGSLDGNILDVMKHHGIDTSNL